VVSGTVVRKVQVGGAVKPIFHFLTLSEANTHHDYENKLINV
jgi:hypothetical protein